MQRETKTVVLPSGTSVTLYAYLTAREANNVKATMYAAMKIDVSSGAPVVSDISGAFMLDQERKLLGILLKSVSGYEGTDPVEHLLDGKNEDYQALIAEVNAIHSGKAPAK